MRQWRRIEDNAHTLHKGGTLNFSSCCKLTAQRHGLKNARVRFNRQTKATSATENLTLKKGEKISWNGILPQY